MASRWRVAKGSVGCSLFALPKAFIQGSDIRATQPQMPQGLSRLRDANFAGALFLSARCQNCGNLQQAIPQGNAKAPYPHRYQTKSDRPQAILNAGIAALKRQSGFV